MSNAIEQNSQHTVSQSLIKFSSQRQDARTTASEITTTIKSVSLDDEKNENLTLIWRSILGVVTSIPNPSYVTGTLPTDNLDILTKYVDLIDAIRTSPNAISHEDMTSWGIEVRDAYNRSPTPPSSTNYSLDEWTNLNSFLALLTSKHTLPPKSLDFSLYAIWALRDALETEQSADTINALLPAAAAWVDNQKSGKFLYESDRQWQPSPKTGAPARTGSLWQVGSTPQENGFSRERWRFWQQRFEQISEDETYSQVSRDTAQAAVLRMKEVEDH